MTDHLTPLEAAKRLIVTAAVGLCTCNTKSPELFWHEANCRYVVLMTALENLESPAPPNGTTAAHQEMQELFTGTSGNVQKALQHYADQYCEGWCKDCPPETSFNDCGGCRARPALARLIEDRLHPHPQTETTITIGG